MKSLLNLLKGLFDQENKTRISTNVFWLLVSNFVRMPFGFISNILLANYLSTEILGVWSYGRTLVVILLPLAMLAPDHILCRELSKNKDQSVSILSHAILLKLLGSSLALSVGIVFATWNFDDTYSQYISAILLTLVFTEISGAFSSWFRSQTDSTRYLQLEVVVYLIWHAFVFLSVTLEFSFAAIVAGHIVQTALIVGVGYFLYRAKVGKLALFAWDKKYFRLFAKNSFPLALSTSLFFLAQKGDKLVVESNLNLESLGIYSVASVCIDIIAAIPFFVAGAAAPKLIFKYSNLKDRLNGVRRISTALLLGCSVLCLGTGLIAPFFLELVLEERLFKSINILLILLPIGVLNAFEGVIYHYLIALSRFDLLIVKSGMTALAVAIGSYIGSTYGDIQGAAWGTLIGTYSAVLSVNMVIPTLRQAFLHQLGFRYRIQK